LRKCAWHALIATMILVLLSILSTKLLCIYIGLPISPSVNRQIAMQLLFKSSDETREKELKLENKAIEIDPEYAEAFFRRGWSYAILGNETLRDEGLDRIGYGVIEIPDDEIKARSYYMKAIKDFKKAIDLRLTRKSVWRTFNNVNYQLAFCSLRLKQYTEAEKNCREELRINPNDKTMQRFLEYIRKKKQG